MYVGQVIVSSDDLKPLKNLAHSFNIKANFKINDEEQLKDQIETHNFKLEDIFNEAEENVDDQKTIAELLGEVDCDLEIKGIMDVEAQLNESEKNEDSNEKIKEKMSSNGGNKDPFYSNINLNKDKKDHNNHKIFQNSSQISMITNVSQKVEFGGRSIPPFSFQTQSEENTTVVPIIESEGKISRKSEIIKDDENSNDYSNFELTFKTDNVGKKNMRDDIDQKRERMKNKMKKKCNYCDSYVIN